MNSTQMQSRLLDRIRMRLRNGEWTERGFARTVALSQPHINKVLKGTRTLSLESMDAIFHALAFSVLDLFTEQELRGELAKRSEIPAARVELRILSSEVGAGCPWNPNFDRESRFQVSSSLVLRADEPVAMQIAGTPEVAVLDVAQPACQILEKAAEYVVEFGNDTLLGTIRRGRGCIYLIPAASACQPTQWKALPLREYTIRGKLIWRGSGEQIVLNRFCGRAA